MLSKGLGPAVWGEAEGAFGDAVSWGSGRRLLPGHVCGAQSWDESGREGAWASWQRRDGLTGVSGDSNGMRFPNHGKVGVRFVWRRGRWRRGHPLDGIAF